jgi:hypothetical protein
MHLNQWNVIWHSARGVDSLEDQVVVNDRVVLGRPEGAQWRPLLYHIGTRSARLASLDREVNAW